MTRGTALMVLLAALTAAGAVVMRPKPLATVQFEETGTEFFADFGDPTAAAALEVVAWDDEEAAVKRFSVKLQDGQWIIPSHHDYPADATERMGKAASSFIGVNRDVFYGDDPKQHGAFGLLDPDDPAGDSGERAQRVTIKDEAGTVLVDVLVGKEIPDKAGFRYLRLPDDRRVYGAELEVDISTDFTDWIEKDLLHVERDDIVALQYDPYTVDEAVGQVVGSDPLRVQQKTEEKDGAETKQWVATAGKPPGGKELDESAIRQVIGAVDRLQIVGVRARPERLTLVDLQAKGFFVNPNSGRLFGNEGELHIIQDDGVVYTLFFGEITFDSGLALTAGQDAAPKEEAAEGEASDGTQDDNSDAAEAEGDPQAAKEGAESGGNRYLFVDVRYEPELAKEFGAQNVAGPGENEAEGSKAKEDDAASELEGDSPPVEGENGDEASGQKRAADLAKRFSQWFFVISDQSFKQIHKDKGALFKDTKSN